jgi:signal transduction histidine kinase
MQPPKPRVPFRHSLRARLALSVALPMLIVLSSISIAQYWRARTMLEERLRTNATQIGAVLTGSLRHAMLENNRQMIEEIIANVGSMDTIKDVLLLNIQGRVMVSSNPTQTGDVYRATDSGCAECHSISPALRPRTALLSHDSGLLRIASPIANEPGCTSCHGTASAHLGMLLVDVPIAALEQHLVTDLQTDLAVSVLATTIVTLAVYLLVHWLIVRRIETFRLALTDFAAGNLSARLPARVGLGDELNDLAQAVNSMANDQKQHLQEQTARSELRQRAIVEERERIARELHDGMAQLLGYVNTKAMAVRLRLQKGQLRAASRQLEQLEGASRELYVDVREAILGLKATDPNGRGLAEALQDITTQFGRLGGLPIELKVSPQAAQAGLSAEAELQLMRIIQEALTNVRKHARALHAVVELWLKNGQLVAQVSDDGQGFDPLQPRDSSRPHFGLSSMRERAQAIGAELAIRSAPGAGTRLTIRLPAAQTGEDHARPGR